jgi:alpha-mannosidase
MKLFRLFVVACILTFCAGRAAAQEQETPAPKTYKIYAVCDAHLDTQWNWDLTHTIREYIPRILFQNLWMLERYPDYKFNFEGGIIYRWMKEYYPLHYARLQKYIDEGRWHISGASWNANDPNMPSAESFIRNILQGQELYKREFGVRSTDIFLPDCFGFGYTLPSLAAHCGLIGFSTQKLSWRKHDFFPDAPYHKKNPFSWGVWYGIDGQSLMAAFDTGGYTAELPADAGYNKDFIRRASNGFDNTAMRYYSGGHLHGTTNCGDKGNSGTVTTARRMAEAMADPDAPVQLISATSDQLFLDYMDRRDELPTYDGELLMDVHAGGCYTSQGAMKYYNRRNEELLGAAVAADWLGAKPYDRAKLNEVWQRVLWHQFHDDLTGTSIADAYRYSWNDELISLQQATEVMTAAVGALSHSLDTRVKGTPVVVYNPVTYDLRDLVEAEVPLDARAKGVAVYAPSGRRVAAQILSREGDRARILFAADVKAAGYAVYDVRPASGVAKSSALKASERTLENRIYRVELDANGDIRSIRDKRAGRELVAEGKAFRMAVFEGNPSNRYPAWEIMKETMDKPGRPIDGDVRISIAEQGPVRATLKVERSYGPSKFVQYVSLTDGGDDDRIDVRNTVDWSSRDVLLKAEFPCAVANAKAAYDLGLGFIERGNNTETAYEVPAQKWVDLTDADGSYGVTILNDCKYGWDKPADNTLRLTLLHTPSTEKRYAHQRTLDHGVHHYTYSIVGHTGARTEDALVAGEALNMPLVAFVAPKHAGHLGRTFSMLAASTPQIGVRALKAAEDGDGYIVRCYETTGNPVEGARITFPAAIVSAEECNGIEERIGDAAFEGRSLVVSAGKFAPKTYRVRLAEPAVRSTLAIDNAPVKLDYDITAYTTDEFFTYYTIDKALGSFAAELIPATVECDGVTFAMGEANTDDAVLCNGQTVALPADRTYTKLYVLASAVEEPRTAEFRVGDRTYEAEVPLWKGFYGQWGWYGNSEGFMQRAKIGYLGTHRHQTDLGNVPYGFSYMYLLTFDIPEGATTVTLPKDKKVLVYAMTASNNPIDDVKLASRTFVRPDER